MPIWLSTDSSIFVTMPTVIITRTGLERNTSSIKECTMNKEFFENVFEERKEAFIEGWKQFLRFPSISAEAAHADDCRNCAGWLVSEMERIGFKSRLLETSSLPVVYGEFQGRKKGPQILFYGHYDVQPVDPLDLWHSQPFEPELRGPRMYARGAQDNKGQVFYFLKALEVLIAEGRLECPVKVFLEGEEESGGQGIMGALPTWGELIKGDVLMVCDTGIPHAQVPAITLGLRGVLHLMLRLSGPKSDLHSGMHGGAVKNPASEMARMVASLHKSDGSIAVAGYYDDLLPVDELDLKLAMAEAFDEKQYEESTGVKATGGEQGRSCIERRGFRPTIEVNGIHSGYEGPGNKTIIPAIAEAKISSRLAAGQDPARCLEMIKTHFRAQAPAEFKLEFPEEGVGGPALRISASSRAVEQAREVLRELYGERISHVWEGASIPIVSTFAELSGAEPLLVGFGLDLDSIHAPNESFSLEQFKQGFLYSCLYLSRACRA